MSTQDSTEWKRMLHAAHLCCDCKKQDAYTLAGRWHCAECSAKRNERHNATANATGYYKDIWKKRKTQQWEWRAQGRCYKCGRERTDKRYKLCGRCRAKNRAYRYKIATPKTRQGQRGKDGRCWTCNEAPVEPGYNTCPACHAKLKAQMAINASHSPENHPWRNLDDQIFKRRNDLSTK